MRKLLRILGYTAASALLLLLVSVLTASAYLRHRYLQRDERNVNWLRAHRLAEAPVDTPFMLTLPPGLAEKRLVLLAEIHGTAAPQTADLALLTALAHQSGLRDYLAELDPVEAALLNQYLATGDDAPLRRVFDVWTPSAQWGNLDFEDKVRAIRTLNSTLPADRQIRFIGIDEVQHFPLAVSWIEAQCGCQAPAGTAQESTRAAQAQSTLAFLDKEVLGDKATAAALHHTLEQTAGGNRREKTIFENYRWQVTSGPLGSRPAYGMWGFAHGLQDRVGAGYTFAGLVRHSTLPAAQSLATIACLPTRAHMMLPAGYAPRPLRPANGANPQIPYGVDGPAAYMAGIEDLRAAASGPGRLTLYALDDAGSPYRDSLILGPNWSPLGSIALGRPGAVTTDYIQYALYYDGSRAVRTRHPGE